MTALEACTLLLRPPSVMLRLVEVEGLEHLERAATPGRGVLLLTAHLGNWELLAAAHVLTGRPLSEVVRPLDQPVLDRLVARLRRRTGVEVIPKQRGLRGILDALRRGRMVGILLDQNASRAEGVFVPFFGTPASTSRGMALAALRSGAPVLPVFIRRGPDGRHRVQIQPEVLRPVNRDPTAFTAALTAAIEAEVRRVPEQWLWAHRRWRTRPPGEG
jgi:KDO2-lipid IV(A) lauroyltransferase